MPLPLRYSENTLVLKFVPLKGQDVRIGGVSGFVIEVYDDGSFDIHVTSTAEKADNLSLPNQLINVVEQCVENKVFLPAGIEETIKNTINRKMIGKVIRNATD